MTGQFAPFADAGFAIDQELGTDAVAREALLDRVMGEGRKRKSSERLRRGRLPSAGLAFVARSGSGSVIGSVRLWDVACRDTTLLLLGPLAVETSVAGQGIGAALMRHAMAQAAELGHGAIILVGDAPYYARFGFSAEKTGGVMMPGPVERDRLLGCELRDSYLDDAGGLLVARGRRVEPRKSPGDAVSQPSSADFVRVA